MHTLGTCQHISQVGRLGCAPATGVCAEAESAARVWLPTRGGQAHQLETCLWHRYWHVQRLAAKRPVSGLVAEPLLMHWVQIRKNWPQINHGRFGTVSRSLCWYERCCTGRQLSGARP